MPPQIAARPIGKNPGLALSPINPSLGKLQKAEQPRPKRQVAVYSAKHRHRRACATPPPNITGRRSRPIDQNRRAEKHLFLSAKNNKKHPGTWFDIYLFYVIFKAPIQKLTKTLFFRVRFLYAKGTEPATSRLPQKNSPAIAVPER